MPPSTKWEQIAEFGPDTLNGGALLSSVTDTTLDYDLVRYGQKHLFWDAIAGRR